MRAYRVAYDGRPYHGFQRQPDVPTVEDALLAALSTLDAIDSSEEGRPAENSRPTPAEYAAAGRTDAGVSAVAQTVAFDAPDWLSPAAFNSELPRDVRVWASADASEDFHATHDATSREYTYFLHAPDADDQRAEEALEGLAGTHDFHNLTPDATGTVRDLSTDLDRDGPSLVVTFRAGGFCRQLVRRAVSVVAEVARGDAGLGRVERLLGDEPLDGSEGVPPAPPYPLVLTDVSYPSLSFETDGETVASARELFTDLHERHATRARVASGIVDRLGE
jgi:tRNA pseudouridine38-40 synthase